MGILLTNREWFPSFTFTLFPQISMKTLKLTEDQFEVLYDAVQETIYQVEEALEGTDLTLDDYEIYEVFRKLKKMGGQNDD